MTNQDRHRLGGCDPVLIAKVDVVLEIMAAAGHLMMVTDGFRTVGQQQVLWAKGRDAVGKIIAPKLVVTYADGVRTPSNHQSGRACDCCFVVEGKPSWKESLPWEIYGEAAESMGMEWGGRWKDSRGRPRPDRPHIQLAPLPKGTLRA